MMWGSGTRCFDRVLDIFLEQVPEGDRKPLVRECYDLFRPEEGWGTQDESKYYLDYIVHFEYEDGFLDWEDYVTALGYEFKG